MLQHLSLHPYSRTPPVAYTRGLISAEIRGSITIHGRFNAFLTQDQNPDFCGGEPALSRKTDPSCCGRRGICSKTGIPVKMEQETALPADQEVSTIITVFYSTLTWSRY